MATEYDLGLRLKKAREKKKVTQEQAGRFAGVSGTSISGYENNIADPPVDVMRRLASFYGVTTDYLYGLENRKTIVIDGVTPEQEEQIEVIIKMIQNLIKNG